MNRWALFFWGLLIVVLAGMYGIRMYERRAEARVEATSATVSPPLPAVGHEVAPFTLTERSGQPFDSKQLEGKVWIASFFFANCPGACLVLNGAISQLQKDLQGLDVTFVSITVDPEHDTPEELAKFAPRYTVDPERWFFLTGDMQDIEKLATDSFQVTVKQVTHSDRLILVDREGKVRGTYRANDPSQVLLLKQEVKKLVEEPT
jgi:cytochrome oxidase Cu insertion factor (SCO1/SenC/PrrC family)